ncbi:MAG TPA: SRPBCC domain-containing protein [Gemmatimonadales bacterium]
MSESGRKVSVELSLDAALVDAWKALTDARELTRWFPLAAKADGRSGGQMVWDWGDKFHWATRIDVWEPPRRLRLVQDVEHPHDATGKPILDESIPAASMALEFVLRTYRGKTRLRLVHSGFGEGAAWDDELEGVRNGWAFELGGLAHYLARHRGKDRHVGWGTLSTGASHADVWRRLLGEGGYAIEARALAAGEPYTVRTPEGTTLSGIIRLHHAQREFVGTVRELDDGLLRLGSWAGGGATGVNVWVATWSPAHQAQVLTIGAAAQDFLNRALDGAHSEPSKGIQP